MASEIRDPTGDTETGADITTIGIRRHRTAQYLVADVVEVDTGNNGGGSGARGEHRSNTTPPHKDGQKTRGGGQNGREGGRSA